VPGGNLAHRIAALEAPATSDGDGVTVTSADSPIVTDETVGTDGEAGRVPPAEPAMPVMPFPTFKIIATLPHQSPGNGFESGRDSRAR
jgi:hypothetical protein